MMDFWRQLTELLKVRVDVRLANQVPPVVAQFIVSNEASPPSVYWPEVVFEDVVLHINGAHNLNLSEKVGTLIPGQSVTHEHRLTYADLVELRFNVERSVSRAALFRVRPSGGTGDLSVIPLKGYLEEFASAAIHPWRTAFGSFPSLGPDTTLKELEVMKSHLGDIIAQIRDERDRLQRLAGLVRRGREREVAFQHSRTVYSYLDLLERRVAEVREAVASSNPKAIKDTLTTTATRLEGEAKAIDQATESLRREIDSGPS